MIKHHFPLSVIRASLTFILCLALALLTACGRSSEHDHHLYSHQARGSAIAASAKSQIGRPYCKGGISPRSGFDCSGLVFWACAQNGVRVPRVSKEQASIGQEISRSSLRPGDIVVFKTGWTSYHTGIYLGQGRFVHSPRPRTRVRIDSLYQDYWKEHYRTARRVARP